jgi:hypothetical protein
MRLEQACLSNCTFTQALITDSPLCVRKRASPLQPAATVGRPCAAHSTSSTATRPNDNEARLCHIAFSMTAVVDLCLFARALSNGNAFVACSVSPGLSETKSASYRDKELKESYMGAETPVETQSSIRKVIFYATVISGLLQLT